MIPAARRKASSLLIAIVTAAVSFSETSQAAGLEADFFVAPGGSDANPGTAERPFATIGRARDAVRRKIAAGLQGDVAVAIGGGTYCVSEPIRFGPEDGGTERFAVTYAAQPGEEPVISGGRKIGGWQAGGNGTWTARIPEAAAGQWTFRELFVGGRRAPRARHPNQGFLRVEKVGEDRRTNFRYAGGDLRAYHDLENLELVFLHDWSITRTPVKSIDEQTRVLIVPRQIGGPSRWAVMDWFEKQPRYFVENSAELLDAAGEWLLDPAGGVLHYVPRKGEKPGEVETVAPVAPQLLVVRGDPDGNRPVRNLHFVGLRFEHAAWSPPERTHWGRQACTYWTMADVPGGVTHHEADEAAVHFELAEGCSLEGGGVAHVGRSGIWLGRGCRDCRVAGCAVSDCGGIGIMIGEGQARQVGDAPWWEAAPDGAATANTVTDCLVEECGRELFGAVGIWMGLAGKTSIVCNEVRQLPYTGVSIGWMWWDPRARPEPRGTPCRETLVADNHIHHVMQTLSDGGGIYSLGTQPGSALRGNLIHDVPANAGRAESNGMFLDQGTGEFVIHQNVIYNIDRSPLRFHKGWENLVRDNWLEVTEGVPPVRYNDTKAERITLEDNRVVSEIPPEVLQAARRRTGPRGLSLSEPSER